MLKSCHVFGQPQPRQIFAGAVRGVYRLQYFTAVYKVFVQVVIFYYVNFWLNWSVYKKFSYLQSFVEVLKICLRPPVRCKSTLIYVNIVKIPNVQTGILTFKRCLLFFHWFSYTTASIYKNSMLVQIIFVC